jgi:hypothetical protein
MNQNGCSVMELECLELAKTDFKNRGKWIAQAERWHELARVQNSWRLQKPPQQVIHAGPMEMQRPPSTLIVERESGAL